MLELKGKFKITPSVRKSTIRRLFEQVLNHTQLYHDIEAYGTFLELFAVFKLGFAVPRGGFKFVDW